MKRLIFALSFVAAIWSALYTSVADAQTAFGLQKFGSFGGGPFDVLNLGNLDVHFSVPIVHKAGRGIPFDYSLNYDSSMWQPVNFGSYKQWQPVTNIGNVQSYWGWSALAPTFTPYVGYSVLAESGNCGSGGQSKYTIYVFTNFVYYDAVGSSHAFGISGQYNDSGACQGYGPPPGPVAPDPGTGVSDGLTIAAYWGVNSSSGYLTTTSGALLNVPFYSAPPTASPYTATDANGNKITFSNGIYTDTLGTSALTVTGSASSPPVKFTYLGPGSTQPYYQVNYTGYNVKTAFNCSGINELYQASVNLPTSIILPDGSQYTLVYEATPGYNGWYTTGRVVQVTLPTGGTISYSYTANGNTNDGINCADGSTNYVQRTITPGNGEPTGTWTYTRSGSGQSWETVVNDPNNNQTAIWFEQNGLNFYETQRIAYQGTTSGTPVSTNINCYNGQSVGSPASCYNTTISLPISRITNFSYLPTATGLQAETDSDYDTSGYALITKRYEYDYGSAAVGSLIRETATTYASLGNGIVDRPSNVSVYDGGGALKASTTYQYDQSALATPSGTTPNWVSVSGSRGNVTTVQAQTTTAPAYLYRKYTYYNTGRLSTSTAVSTSNTNNGATTTYNYSATNNADCGNAFVTSISEPVANMTRSYQWDCNGGVLTNIIDENGNSNSLSYGTDVFWRLTSTTDFSQNMISYLYYLTSSPPVEYQSEAKSATFGNNSIIDNVTTVDGFGRTLFSQTKQAPNASNYDTIATCYDSFGRVGFTSIPYATTLATGSTTCPSNVGLTYSYNNDALGFLSTIQNNQDNGYVSYSYNKNDVTETRGSPTISKQYEVDATGRLTSVCEITSGTSTWPNGSCNQNTAASGYLTKYTYDLLDNITGVSQNAQSTSNQQSRSYTYDMLSRLTQELNPETNNTSTNYVYDSASNPCNWGSWTVPGDLLEKTDPNGNSICFQYDSLNRLTAIGNSNQTTTSPVRRFYYDNSGGVLGTRPSGVTINNSMGRLVEAETDCCAWPVTQSNVIADEWLGYDANGNPTDIWQSTPHSGGYFHSQATLPWPNGALNALSVKNPSGSLLFPTIYYGASDGSGLDGEGRVTKVTASSGTPPVSGVTYASSTGGAAVTGSLTGLTFGTGDSDTFTYDPNSGRQTGYTFSVNGTTDGATTTWNTNSTLSTFDITDHLSGSDDTQNCNYYYDDLGRLGGKDSNGYSVDCGGKLQDLYTFDPFGNVKKSGTFTFQPTYNVSTNRFTISGANVQYDADGNMTEDNLSKQFAWNLYGNPSTINGITAVYDALGQMVEQQNGSANTPILQTQLGKTALLNGSSWKGFVPLPGGGSAIYNSSGLAYYRHADWLGSSRLTTTTSRTVYSITDYAPYGEQYATSGTSDPSFTGQNPDTTSSLYDFPFREHSPSQGRWLSPDPAGLAAVNPFDPQSWNRYAYVGNRPMNTIDPLGFDGCEPGDPFCCDPSDPFCCDPIDPFCCDPSDPFCPEPPPGPPGGGGGGGFPPSPTGYHPYSDWPNGETLGLPGGLNLHPFGNIGNLFGFLPGLPNPWILDAHNTLDNGEIVWVGDRNGEPGGCQDNGICVIWDDVLRTWVEDTSTEQINSFSQALNKTGVQSLTNPCTIVGFYGTSAAAGFIGGGAAGSEFIREAAYDGGWWLYGKGVNAMRRALPAGEGVVKLITGYGKIGLQACQAIQGQ